MENIELPQKIKKIEINKNNDNSLNSNINTDSKSEYYKEINTNNELKIGQYMLTPLEALIINKKMPKGYKFEAEEILIKSIETVNTSLKKIKRFNKYCDKQINEKPKKIHTEINNNNLSTDKNKDKDNDKDNSINSNKKKKKLVHKENSINNNFNNNNNNNYNSESYKIMMKCYSCFNKIKSHQSSNLFYFPKYPDSPSLSKIEKRIKNYEYKTINDFCEDLRKLWNYEFKNYAKNPNIYQNICKMSLLSDQICKELSNNNSVIDNKKNEFSNIKKRTDKIKKDIDEIKGNNHNNIYNKNIRQKNLEQINQLGILIKELNKQQLRGIVPILSDKNEINNLKTFEFDLDQLSYDKFKKLEEYVHNCININRKLNKNQIINNKNNELKKVNNKNENININKKNNYESGEKNKTNINKNNNLNNNTNKIENSDKNSNLKDKNTNHETAKKQNEKTIIAENKSFSESDSFSSESSLSD